MNSLLRTQQIFFLTGTLVAQGLSTSALAGLAAPNQAWRTDAIQACFINSEAEYLEKLPHHVAENPGAIRKLSEEEKRNFQAIVDRAFNSQNLGIRFTGFGDCPVGSSLTRDQALGIVGQLESEKFEGLADTGDINLSSPDHPDREPLKKLSPRKEGDRYYNGVALNLDSIDPTFNAFYDRFKSDFIDTLGLSSQDQDKILSHLKNRFKTAIKEMKLWNITHELSHNLGLYHEQARTDAQNPNWCKDVAEDQLQEHKDEEIYKPSRLGTPYDLFSIMNYCGRNAIRIAPLYETLCELKEAVQNNSNWDLPEIQSALSYCSLIEKHPYAPQLSPGDLAVLRNLYAKIPIPPSQSIEWDKVENQKELDRALTSFSHISTFEGIY